MFLGCWYLAISLSRQSLSKIKSPAAAGEKKQKRESRESSNRNNEVNQKREQNVSTGNECDCPHATMYVYIHPMSELKNANTEMGHSAVSSSQEDSDDSFQFGQLFCYE